MTTSRFRDSRTGLWRLQRRRLVQGAIAAAGAGTTSLVTLDALAQPLATPQADLVETQTPAESLLTQAELSTLSAAVDRLIPPADSGPGAAEAGVPEYISRLLGGYGSGSLPLVQAGLAALDAAADGDFGAIAVEEQDEILASAEAGELQDAPEGFFASLLEFTRQGMFCDPVYGGNKDFAGWDLIQYPGVKLLWTEEDQSINTEVEPEHVSIAEFDGVPFEGSNNG